MDQFLINGGRFSAGGDSGSLIVTNTDSCPQSVGLLFAGSPYGTIANPISYVLNAFEVNGVNIKVNVVGDEACSVLQSCKIVFF